MQTFLPYPDFARSAACLDNRRLGKQRVECLQILKALTDSSYGWQNHPAVLMWQGCVQALVNYGSDICDEWISRGYSDTCQDKIMAFYKTVSVVIEPDWLGRPRFHSSHRAALLFKDPAHYSQFGWTETPAIAYWWPTKELA